MDNSITVLIPAHNEEKIICQTINSVFNQTRKPNQVIVISDNSSDNTVKFSYEMKEIYGEKLLIYETVNNKTKKAGALNQVLNNFNLCKFILVMDADTILDKNVIKEGMKYMNNEDFVGAVSSMAGILPNTEKTLQSKILHKFQQLEYATFDAVRVENYNDIKVCAGMCTIYRLEALKSALNFRQAWLDIKGGIYLEDNWAEDYDLTLILKRKWKVAVNLKMKAWTDVPLTLKELLTQRERWYRGGIDCLRMHGFNKYTLKDYVGHMLFWFTFIMQIILTSIIVIQLLTYGHLFFDFYMLFILGAIYVDSIYRMKYVENIKWYDILFKITLIPDFFIMLLNFYSMIKGYYLSFTNKKQVWR